MHTHDAYDAYDAYTIRLRALHDEYARYAAALADIDTATVAIADLSAPGGSIECAAYWTRFLLLGSSDEPSALAVGLARGDVSWVGQGFRRIVHSIACSESPLVSVEQLAYTAEMIAMIRRVVESHGIAWPTREE